MRDIRPRIMMVRPILCALIILAATPGLVFSESGHLVNTTPDGSVNWTTGIATAHGIGIPPKNPANPLQAKEMTRKAAWSVALRNLLEVVKGVHVDSTTTVSNYVAMNDEVRTKVEGFVKGARVVKEQELPDGSFETTVEMKLGGDLTSSIIPKVAPKSEPLANYQKSPVSASKSYTGLVVDARGLAARPALAPRLLNQQGEEAYSVAYVEQSKTARDGIVLYAPDALSAQSNPRVTNTPLLIKALRADGADLYISDADAQTIHGVPEHFKFLKQAKVLVILDKE
jgi:hypothetical protein